eukprot:scaffold8013_cov124-Isochrysis_galbana.AAC.14
MASASPVAPLTMTDASLSPLSTHQRATEEGASSRAQQRTPARHFPTMRETSALFAGCKAMPRSRSAIAMAVPTPR